MNLDSVPIIITMIYHQNNHASSYIIIYHDDDGTPGDDWEMGGGIEGYY